MAEIKTCLFCNEQAEHIGQPLMDQVFKIKCPNCGLFYISGYAYKLFNFQEI